MSNGRTLDPVAISLASISSVMKNGLPSLVVLVQPRH
jgi:hypothetical protein